MSLYKTFTRLLKPSTRVSSGSLQLTLIRGASVIDTSGVRVTCSSEDVLCLRLKADGEKLLSHECSCESGCSDQWMFYKAQSLVVFSWGDNQQRALDRKQKKVLDKWTELVSLVLKLSVRFQWLFSDVAESVKLSWWFELEDGGCSSSEEQEAADSWVKVLGVFDPTSHPDLLHVPNTSPDFLLCCRYNYYIHQRSPPKEKRWYGS